MKKLLIMGIMVLLVVGLTVAVKPETTGNGKFKLSAKAKEVAPGVYDLGMTVDKGKLVQGYAFVHYKDAKGKPSGCNDDGVCQGWEPDSCGDCSGGSDPTDPTDPAASCYGYLAKGAKWKSVEPYMVDPTNVEGLDETYVRDNLALDIAKWETAAGYDILGDEVSGIVDGADTVTTDGKNEVLFGDIEDSNAIGVTIIWGIFGGAPKNRMLVEWDQVYDQADFDWGVGDPLKMDFENIATHELGHSVGMGDLYESGCSEQTMYGYATEGEVKKRDLEAGDVVGIQRLY